MKACLTPDRAQAFAFGETTEAEQSETREHLADCRACRQWISALVSDADSEHSSVLGPETAPNAGAPEHLNVGDRVGRYRIVEFIGRGGMGSVFAGHDPVLERKVAIKVLHRDIGLSTARLASEGQTLAQIRDPHIVEVYDVGVSPEGPYVVMELVAGTSLREWLLTPRSLRAVLGAFMDAAAALSSAHRCGIVHGDFKPANVIVGEHGRVCVIDFGLAAPVPTTTDSSAPSDAVAGTPGYLAPELLEGCAATPDSDQYAFCVALQRALEAPTCRGRPSSRLRRALARGLHPDPQARWPTMDALRNALHGAFRPARALGVLALGAGAVALCVAAWPEDEACAEDAPTAPAWDTRAQVAFRDHVEASGQPWARRAADRSTQRVDTFVSQWTRAYTQSCAATGAQAETSLACLASQADRFNGSLELVAALDPLDPTRLDALLDLPRPGVCTTGDDAVDPGAAAALGLPIARLEGLADAGYLQASSRLAAELAPKIEASGSPRLAARLALVQGSVLAARRSPGALEHLEQASSLASEVGDDHLQARAAIVLAESLALYELGRGDAVTRAIARADGLLARADADATLQRRLVRVRAAARANAGDDEQALALYEQATRLSAQVYGEDAPPVAIARLDVAEALLQLGDIDRAEQVCRSALSTLESSFGSDHPSVAGAFERLGSTLLAQGRSGEAADAFAQTLRIREAINGPDSLSVAVALGNLGGALTAAGSIDEAIPMLERAAALEESSDTNGPRLISVLNHLGNAHRLSDRPEDAQRAYARGVVIAEASLGPEHPGLAVLLGGLAAAQLETEPSSSLATAQRALKIRRASLGPDHPAVAFNLLMVGHAQARLDDVDAAVATMREAEDLATAHPAAKRLLPDIRFGLAQILEDAGRPGARPLAESAARSWADMGDEASLAEVRAWLREAPEAGAKKNRP